MSRPRELVSRLAQGTGFADVRGVRKRITELEEAVAENRRLDVLLAQEVAVVEQQVADVAQAFLDRR